MLEFDEEKYNRDCALDGYYMLVTSELELPDSEIIEKYRGLWRIEESFRILKSDLEGRPVYVWTKEHIEAHFLVCFISLTILRIMQFKLNYTLTAEQLQTALNSAECLEMSKGIYFLAKRKDGYSAIESCFSASLDFAYTKIENLKKYHKSILHNIF